MHNRPLDPAARLRMRRGLSLTSTDTPLDLLVVGGGVTGAGAAFDAASRGLSVGLVEARDWASGTSQSSSKLMHGGLRYLEMLDFGLVAEALAERDRLLNHTAPHLVTPVRFIFPYKRALIDRAYLGSGVLLYDSMAARPGHKRALPRHQHLDQAQLATRFAGLSTTGVAGALEYSDAKVDDARFVLTLVRSAVSLGAAGLNYCRATEFITDPQSPDQVVGVRAVDETDGHEFTVRARHTLLAGGVFTQQVQDLAGTGQGLHVNASKGVHITVPRERITAEPDVGIITKTEKSVLFIIPWDEYWVIGTTDTPWPHSPAQPVANAADIDYLLAHANAVLAQPLHHDDILGVYAGLRPLLQEPTTDRRASTKVSREHAVAQLAPGLSAIAGGKFTTYRVMAEDAVDFALGPRAKQHPSLTADAPLLGAHDLPSWQARTTQLCERYGWSERRFRRLLHRYGSTVAQLLELIDTDHDLNQPLTGAPRYLRAEIVHAAHAEAVVTLADVLCRRTRIVYEFADRGLAAATEVAGVLADELGWDEAQVAAELATYREYVAGLQAAASASTDDAALAAYRGHIHTANPGAGL